MNYFEIFNKVLLELNYRAVQSFEAIYKSEHNKILEAINRTNNDVLASYEWPFLERAAILDVIEGENIYQLPFKGNIKSVFHKGERVLYTPRGEDLMFGRLFGNYYSVINDRIIFEKPRCDKIYSIIYYTTNYAFGEDGEFKPSLDKASDTSIIPMPYAEHILVYGSCLKVKANPSYPKFGFWNTMYIQALANLRQKSPRSVESEPFISLM